MKKVLIAVIGLTLLFISAAAFARPGGMMRCNTEITAEQQKLFDETKDLRKEMHDKRFELMEAYRVQNPDEQKISALEKEIDITREKMQNKAKELGITTGFGNCGNQGQNCQNPGFNDSADNSHSPCGNCNQNRSQKGCGMMQGRMMR